jgi:hypothetical protein
MRWPQEIDCQPIGKVRFQRERTAISVEMG